MFNIKARINTFDQWMMAATFAQAGERETALEMMNQSPRKKNRKRVKYRVIKREEQRPVLRA
ncbi:MAG: hypothetical protein V1689_14505 [Pseudomonadota bacterium]